MHTNKLLLVPVSTMIEWEIEDPLVKEPKLMGQIARDKVFETFVEFDWREMQDRDGQAQLGNFFHSPGIYFKDKTNCLEICFSLINERKEFEFLVFYERTKMVKGFFGFGEKEKSIVSDLRNVSFTDCKAILKAFIAQDREALEKVEWE